MSEGEAPLLPLTGTIVFLSSVSSNLETKKNQQKIKMVLDGKKIPYRLIDISSNEEGKQVMRELAGNPKCLPPQIANGDQYCGDFAAFDEAVEMENLNEFLKLS